MLIWLDPKPPAFDARFVGKGEEKVEVNNGEDAEKIRAALEKADWVVRTVDRKNGGAMPLRHLPPASCNRIPRASCASASSAP